MRRGERIPLHAHTDGNDGGRLPGQALRTGAPGTSVTVSAGGSSITLSDATPLVESGSGSAGTGTQASRDTHVHPAFAVPVDHGDLGAAATLSLDDGSTIRGTLTADCGLTFPTGASDVALLLRFILDQDATGGWVITWPASVVWPRGVTPTFDTTPYGRTILDFLSIDGGVTWYGDNPRLGTRDLWDVQDAAPTDGDVLGWVAANGRYEPGPASAPPSDTAGLLTVDPGTPSYDDSGDDVEVTLASVWGYGADGPYYNAAGATSGEEAILTLDPSDGQLVVIPYVP